VLATFLLAFPLRSLLAFLLLLRLALSFLRFAFFLLGLAILVLVFLAFLFLLAILILLALVPVLQRNGGTTCEHTKNQSGHETEERE